MAASIAEEIWPPRSARQALLSSPSGKKRYADLEAGTTVSPTKRLPGTPSLLDRLRLARNGQDQVIQPEEEDEEEDEETLQLKLAAIEAKLKLKKLQNKAKKEDVIPLSRPVSVAESSALGKGGHSSQIEVTLSPIKRPTAIVEQKSPSRVLLGIDKGMRGSDISLRRAKMINGSPVRDKVGHTTSNISQPTSRTSITRSSRKGRAMPAVEVKSFSERMAQARGDDRKQTDKREDLNRARARTFKLDAAEIERFRAAAEESQSHIRPRSPVRDNTKQTPANADISCSTQPFGSRKAKTPSDLRSTSEEQVGNANLFEGFSGLHLSSRVLPHSFLKRTLPSDRFTIYRIPDLLKNITSPAYEIPDEVGDFVVFGVIASKSSPLDQKNRANDMTKSSNEWEKKWDDGSQNRQKFMVFTLTDLKWTVDLYLFESAVPRYHRLTTGTVVAILNPSIMPPKKGREDTGAFSLALHDGDDTVLEVGLSQHLGYCNAVKKDGKECGQWVNGAKSEICEWHLNAQVARTQSKRMGVNTGANGFGGNGQRNGPHSKVENQGRGNGLLPTKNVRGFDRWTSSHYYISSSNPGARGAPMYNADISTARMLDMDDDDPFVAEGQFSRDKEALIKKRMANQEKERNIAKQLASLGSGSSAGADYMRRRADDSSSIKQSRDYVHQRGELATAVCSSTTIGANGTKSVTENLKTDIGKKRAAEDVRLSPVKKKTRFLTEKGIKEVGRESMGPNTRGLQSKHDFDDDDDDLDIV